VLCGPFTGPVSNAMAVTIAAPTCWPTQNWAVFRFTAGDWQLVLNQPAYLSSPLVAVGSDIRETTAVHRSGDPRCFFNGGTHARIWHWDRTRLVPGAWKQVTPAQPKKRPRTLHLYQFVSPSHNVGCRLGDEGLADCVSKRPPQKVHLSLDGKLWICRGGDRCGVCSAGPPKCSVVPVPTLAYGTQDVYAGFRCLSQRIGITCTVIRSGKGFLINRAGVRRVGP